MGAAPHGPGHGQDPRRRRLEGVRRLVRPAGAPASPRPAPRTTARRPSASKWATPRSSPGAPTWPGTEPAHHPPNSSPRTTVTPAGSRARTASASSRTRPPTMPSAPGPIRRLTVVAVWFTARTRLRPPRRCGDIGATFRPVPDADETADFTAKNGGVLMVRPASGPSRSGLGFRVRRRSGHPARPARHCRHQVSMTEEAFDGHCTWPTRTRSTAPAPSVPPTLWISQRLPGSLSNPRRRSRRCGRPLRAESSPLTEPAASDGVELNHERAHP